MKSKISAVIVLLLIISLSLVSWRKITGGFRPYKIIGTIPHDISFSSISFQTEDIKNILNQKFEYLSKGSQIFAFSSQDGKYILKFIRLSKYQEPFRRIFLSHLFPPSFFAHTFSKNKNKNFYHVIQSYKIAFEDLKDETKLIYIHLSSNPSPIDKLKISDNFGFEYTIDANNCMFLLQKKGCRIKDDLLKALDKRDFAHVRKNIIDYLILAKKVIQKGILNKDSSIKNLGYIDDMVAELDLGRFERVNITDKSSFLKKYTQFYRNSLLNCPEMLEFFDRSSKELFNE